MDCQQFPLQASSEPRVKKDKVQQNYVQYTAGSELKWHRHLWLADYKSKLIGQDVDGDKEEEKGGDNVFDDGQTALPRLLTVVGLLPHCDRHTSPHF